MMQKSSIFDNLVIRYYFKNLDRIAFIQVFFVYAKISI